MRGCGIGLGVGGLDSEECYLVGGPILSFDLSSPYTEKCHPRDRKTRISLAWLFVLPSLERKDEVRPGVDFILSKVNFMFGGR